MRSVKTKKTKQIAELTNDNCNMSAHMIYDKLASKEDFQINLLSLSKTNNANISTMAFRTTICSKHKFNKTLNDTINQVLKYAKISDEIENDHQKSLDDCEMLHSP
ncbi:hypothetical protein GJ496_009798 [Pomphorhynchus laevis]|nr:hypothetical protein GJ496_009798 [Pomphorhynchus laevis]